MNDSRGYRRWYKKILSQLAIMGTISMIAMTTAAASTFKLKQPEFYFSSDKTVTLLEAALSGNIIKAKELVKEGADPNDEGPRINPYNRLRPLHYAIAANNAKAVNVLVAVGADPELSAQGYGRSFLFAMTLKNMEVLSLLLELRPINTLSNETIELLLFESITDNCPRCLEVFLNNGAPIDMRDGAGYTVMMRAIDAEDYDMAEWLISRGASVNIEAKGGMTPAYSIQYDLQKFKPGNPTYNKVLHLKQMMEERGAVFPALTPAEVRAKRAKQ